MDFHGGLKDDRTSDHPTNGKNSVQTFYLAKLQEFRNPKLIAAEECLRHQRVVLETRRKKSHVYKDRLHLSLYCSSCYKEDQKRMIEDLKALQVSLDKLIFANNRSPITPIGPNTFPEEIDNLGLHFGFRHGSNNLADERKILKKVQLTRRRTNSLATLEDYDCRIRELRSSFGFVRHGSAMEKQQQISREITELRLAKEAAVESAVCKGEMWESLGEKDRLQMKIKIMKEGVQARRPKHLKINAETVSKDLARLDKQLSHAEGIVGGAFKRFLRWRNEHQQANVCYNQNISLLNEAIELAERKDAANLRSLCEQQISTFMEKWSNDGDFQNDYKRMSSISLHSRGLCSDGRTRIRSPPGFHSKQEI